MQDVDYAYDYAREVIKGSWPEAEESVAKNNILDEIIEIILQESNQ